VLIIPLLILAGLIYTSRWAIKSNKLISPALSNPRMGINLWLPQVKDGFSDTSAPNITAASAYFVNLDTGEMLFQKDPHQKLKIASLAKIMTAIVVLENHRWTDPILISDNAARMEPDHMELKTGEQLSVEELMHGIFLISANDAAEALAENTLNGRDNFILEMNKKAKQLDMKDTLFINPTGLEEDNRDQYSTAFDVAIMSRYLTREFPHIFDISSVNHYLLPKSFTHQEYEFYSGINLLTSYPGVIGLKTGYTPLAGLTLVTVARRVSQTILGVILNSENRREEAKALLDYSFKKV